MEWYEIYAILDVSFVLMAVFQLYMPAYAAAEEMLSYENINLSEQHSFLLRSVEVATFMVLGIIMFPLLALSFMTSPRHTIKGYAQSIITHARKEYNNENDS